MGFGIGKQVKRMNDETKEEIEAIMHLLSQTLINRGVSMALAFQDKKIYFFDTHTYLETKRMEGVAVDIDSLVKAGGKNE